MEEIKKIKGLISLLEERINIHEKFLEQYNHVNFFEYYKEFLVSDMEIFSIIIDYYLKDLLEFFEAFERGVNEF